ncbi:MULTISPECIES: DUF305 domain-containing protein [Arthrobacter]|uniref:Uncharacterized conserved protein, DUF305 family n=1 Tax=Crystallibacter crystallopoietes TaxID=37928 RepID=A0A1H1FW32_9MICC|nr:MULTISPECIES: DUF305 domain-containing protein [Arthrobacter]AUI52889.1 DUF305 domain-containing protein [Arthrobacter crystallopoietes]MCW2134207.1 Uncharacterized conserved protein, DUF305 family [Arthrobacter sp. VKM Ac-2550]SDR05125.1 Uncharacterized conserved protein, DUF305 family [Arthrobacter crystallopoietes]
MKRFSAISATAVAAALFLAGCGSDTGSDTAEGTMPGMDHGSMSASPSAASSGVAADNNSADAMFAQMMLPHHEQAVEMSDIMLAKDNLDPQIMQLAEDIKAAQGPEIEKMTGWLQAWGEPMEMSGDHAMEGMMSPDDLAQLEAAQGDEAARMFLTQMIAHHEGAVAMAEEEIANGQDPDAVALAEAVVADQSAEIEKMKELLAGL